MKILIAGWFSFERMGATAGDLMAKDVICDWLDAAGLEYDVALAGPFTGGIEWSSARPADYTHVVFVCGPFGRSNVLQPFEDKVLIGIDLSMTEPVTEWNPFDWLFERDSSQAARPDIAMLSPSTEFPMIGLTLFPPEEAHSNADEYRTANVALERLADARSLPRIEIDTRLDVSNRSGLTSPADVDALIRRMDVVLTTRLHGLVLGIKNGVPVVAIDPAPGGNKITAQGKALGWPCVFPLESVTDNALREAFDFCLTGEARALAAECRDAARRELDLLRDRFIGVFSESASSPPGDGRRLREWLQLHPAPPPRRGVAALISAVRRRIDRLLP